MLSRKLKVAVIGIAVAVALPLTYAGATAFWPKCSFSDVYLPYSQENTEQWARIQDIVLVGTVKDVEVRLVELIGDVRGYPTGAYRMSEIPYRFVTIEVEDYLKDRTGMYAKEVTFRTDANGCIDAFGNFFTPIENADYVEYKVGEKSLLTVSQRSSMDGMFIQGHYTYKFDIMTRNGTEIVEANEAANIPEMKLSDLKAEFMAAIDKAERDADSDG